jgi:hypothetical protein
MQRFVIIVSMSVTVCEICEMIMKILRKYMGSKLVTAIPVETSKGNEISRRFQGSRHMKVLKGCQSHPPADFNPPPPRKYSWYSFLLEAELTPGS